MSNEQVKAARDRQAYLRDIFSYHAPVGDQPARYEAIRAGALNFAQALDALVPDGAEKDQAIAALRACVMWANAGIARNPVFYGGEA